MTMHLSVLASPPLDCIAHKATDHPMLPINPSTGFGDADHSVLQINSDTRSVANDSAVT